jgi:hypothetical protein
VPLPTCCGDIGGGRGSGSEEACMAAPGWWWWCRPKEAGAARRARAARRRAPLPRAARGGSGLTRRATLQAPATASRGAPFSPLHLTQLMSSFHSILLLFSSLKCLHRQSSELVRELKREAWEQPEGQGASPHRATPATRGITCSLGSVCRGSTRSCRTQAGRPSSLAACLPSTSRGPSVLSESAPMPASQAELCGCFPHLWAARPMLRCPPALSAPPGPLSETGWPS